MTSSTAAIHVAKKQLGLDDDTYRAKLMRIVGKPSTKDMSEAERVRVLEVFRNEGFVATKPKPSARKQLTGKYAGKLQALWIAGWNLGVIRDREDSALIAFVKRQTGLDAVQFLRFHDDANRAIEAIKAMLKNEGGVDWTKSRFLQPHTQTDGYRIAKAQWKKLGQAGDVMQFAFGIIRKPSAAIEDRDWIPVMNALGQEVRDRKAVAE